LPENAGPLPAVVSHAVLGLVEGSIDVKPLQPRACVLARVGA
jgi:hypothetical protein